MILLNMRRTAVNVALLPNLKGCGFYHETHSPYMEHSGFPLSGSQDSYLLFHLCPKCPSIGHQAVH